MNSSHGAHKSPKTRFAVRLLLVYSIVMAWGAGVALRLVYLQVFQADKYRNQARAQQSGFLEFTSKRGDILDRHLEPLAVTVRADSLVAQPTAGNIKRPKEMARQLAAITGVEESALLEKLTSKKGFVYLARKLSPEQVGRVKALELPGLGFHPDGKRVYPGRETAGHLLGFVGLDNQGLSGIEYRYEELLRGRKKRLHLLMDARRQGFEIVSLDGKEADGNTLVLTIDRALQFIAEEVLQETVEQARALNGSALIMDPNTGEILALASYPFFNPNTYGRYDEEVRRNRAILEIYEPGSTFKIITLSAVLNEQLSRPDEVIDCRVGTLRLAGKVYREAKRSYEDLTFNQILAKSSNVGTIKLGLRLGNERLYNYIERFGFGEKTGVELPGEQSGILRPPSQWSKISIGALSIGQEIGVTPLQMVRAISTFANGGYLVEPQLVRRILKPTGERLDEREIRRKRILNDRTIAQMRDGLAMVVDDGTGRYARLQGYSSAGKTGTAQKFINGHYSHDKFVASYVGFAPVDNTRLAAIVVINEPRGQYYGGTVAGPAFAKIMERALLHLNVEQDRPLPLIPPETDGGHLMAEASASEEELPRDKLESTMRELTGTGEPGEPAGAALVVTTGWFAVPDFGGMNLRQVVRLCTRLGLTPKVSGSGTAIGQRPDPGSMVPKDAVCEIFFSTKAHRVKRDEVAQSLEATASGHADER